MQLDRGQRYFMGTVFGILALGAAISVMSLLFNLISGNAVAPQSVGMVAIFISAMPHITLAVLDRSLFTFGSIAFSLRHYGAEERFNRILLFNCSNWCLASGLLLSAALSDPGQLVPPSVTAALAVFLYGATIYSVISGYNEMRRARHVEPQEEDKTQETA